MAIDMSVDLISATVQLEQPIGDGLRTVGTGFLISDPTPDGTPRVVLVTANHVFERMPGDKATVGFRVEAPDGSWRYAPQKIAIRGGGRELWTHHATRDVACIAITAPAAFARAAIPLNWLGGDDAFNKYQLGPGDEMMALGFPQGLSANSAGFPILRSGRVASYPLGPSSAFPTFLLDFHVFPGNSGGPVYLEDGLHRASGAPADPEAPFVAGMLTQQVEQGAENLEIGIVTQARFIRETVALLDAPPDAAHGETPVKVVGAFVWVAHDMSGFRSRRSVRFNRSGLDACGGEDGASWRGDRPLQWRGVELCRGGRAAGDERAAFSPAARPA